MHKVLILFFAIFCSLTLHFLLLQISLSTGDIQSSNGSVVEIGLYRSINAKPFPQDQATQEKVSERTSLKDIPVTDSVNPKEGDSNKYDKQLIGTSRVSRISKPVAQAPGSPKTILRPVSEQGMVKVEDSVLLRPETLKLKSDIEMTTENVDEKVVAVGGDIGVSKFRLGEGSGKGTEKEFPPSDQQGDVGEVTAEKLQHAATSISVHGKIGEKSAIPRYDINPKPIYPDIALRKGWEGEVLLQVAVKKNGSVEKVVIKRSSGFKELDLSALKAVRRWQFVPAMSGGLPVSGVVIVPINFVLP